MLNVESLEMRIPLGHPVIAGAVQDERRDASAIVFGRIGCFDAVVTRFSDRCLVRMLVDPMVAAMLIVGEEG